jgi:hypothetical protein
MRQNSRKNPSHLPNCFFLLFVFLMCCLCSPLSAQEVSRAASQCSESVDVYDRNFTVKEIRIAPVLKFIPTGTVLKEALAAAMSKQSTTGPQLRINQPFSAGGVSILESSLMEELRARQIGNQSGLIYSRYRLVNCDPVGRTLVVEYRILTIARPSYLTTSFELNDRKGKEKEQAGEIGKQQWKLNARPFVGYNRSRGIYGGTALTYQADTGLVDKFDLNVSGSGSSSVADASFSGTREYASGPLSFAEWRFGYRYSNIPSDAIRLKEATVTAQFFGATHPLGSRNLIFRFGASLEGGNRQTDLAEESVPASNVVRSGYGAAKMYVGASLTSGRQDWKVSYGLQLGNDGSGLSVDFRKQIFDAAYRARFLPRDHKPLQLDLRLTAGSLSAVSGDIPVGERFFGGNAERDFIQGDAWRIRRNPLIRSFPENRLNRTVSGLPIGGENFVSFNLTVAQTVWNRQLMPKEISSNPDVNAGLGGQLLTTRLFLREDAVQASQEISALKTEVGTLTKDGNTRAVVNQLKDELTKLQSGQLPDSVRAQVSQILNRDSQVGPTPLGDVEDAVEATQVDLNASGQPLVDPAAVAAVQNNPVESNAVNLARDDPGDPDDPDDDTISLITVLRTNVAQLQDALRAANMTERGNEIAVVSQELEASRIDILNGLKTVNTLRGYTESQVGPLVASLNQPSALTGRRMDQVLKEIRQLLAPLRASTGQAMAALPADSTDAAVRQQRNALSDFRDLLDATDTYAEKALNAFSSANDTFDSAQKAKDASNLYFVKIDVERLTVGFGGIVSYLTGLANSIRDLQSPLAERGSTPLWNTLHTSAEELLAIQKTVVGSYGKLRVPPAEATANQTVAYVGRVLDVFFRELNIVAISPVLMFDATRLGPGDAPGQGRFRYGIGAGIRLSLVNLDFTAGYSVNPNRLPGEGRGAFVFSMDIGDLFR